MNNNNALRFGNMLKKPINHRLPVYLRRCAPACTVDGEFSSQTTALHTFLANAVMEELVPKKQNYKIWDFGDF